MNNSPLDYFLSVINLLKTKKLYPEISNISGPSCNPEIVINGKKFLTFCSNNYLGLANNQEIKQMVVEAVKKYGIGSASTRLLAGTLDIQVEFERKLAEFYGYEDSITFSSGYLANIGVIRMLIDPFPYFPLPFDNKEGVIFSDELNHASIVDAVRLSKSQKEIYKHNDMKDLERLLNQHKEKKKLIVTDGVYSMDGDLANLKEITRLAKEYNSLIYIDDAHGTGVLGPLGEGTAHHLGIKREIDVIMGSFTKAWGSIGGFVVTRTKKLADYLRVTARSYIFSDPIPPAIVSGLIKTLQLIQEGDELRRKVLENAKYLRTELRKIGFTVLGDIMPIVPVLIPSEKKVIEFSRELHDAGILAPAIRRPAVPEGKERLRLTTMATHTIQQIDCLLENMQKIGKELGVIH